MKAILVHLKIVLPKLSRRALLLTFLYVFVTLSYAQSINQTNPSFKLETNLQSLSAEELISLAKSLASNDPLKSIEIANRALALSRTNNTPSVRAQAHLLLGTLNVSPEQVNVSLNHLWQAVVIFEEQNKHSEQIKAHTHYINLLVDEKRFEEAEKSAEVLHDLMVLHAEPYDVAKSVHRLGIIYFRQKRFNEAITQFIQASNYLTGEGKVNTKLLGDVYIKLAESHKRRLDRPQTAYYYRKALDVYRDLKSKRPIVRTLNTLAEAERHLGNLVVAIDYSKQALEIHQQIDYPEGRAKANLGAGIIYRHIGRYTKSLEHVHEAYLYYKKVNDSQGIANTANQIGYIYTRLKNFDDAKSFYKIALSQPKDIVKSKTRASALREIAVIDWKAGNFESAKINANDALQTYQQLGDKQMMSTTKRILANVYREQFDTETAIMLFEESLEIARSSGNTLYIIKALMPLGRLLISENPDEAIKLLSEALILAESTNDAANQLYAHRYLHQAEKVRGNYIVSLNHAEAEIGFMQIIGQEMEDKEIVFAKAALHSHQQEMEMEELRDKSVKDEFELARQNGEIELSKQTKLITELELTKNKYASITLALLLVVCLLVVVLIYRRFAASKEHNKELSYLAGKDPLTDCCNRRVLFKRLEADFADTSSISEYCIVMADIDHFKRVNDIHGHTVGDTVIKGIADILKQCVRTSDVIARFGGEEFCVVLPLASIESALKIAEKMRDKVEATKFEKLSVTCSFGVSSITFNAKTPEKLIEQADLALYKSKHLGRNKVSVWDKTLSRDTI